MKGKGHKRQRFIVLIFGMFVSAGLGAESVFGRVVSITDGDTFTLLTAELEQLTIRVAEIDAPERDQPYGSRSSQKLSDLIFGKDTRIEIQVVDNFGRLVGRPYIDETDISAEMIKVGAAWVYRSYSEDVDLYELERRAKANKVGIWSLSEYERTPPWEWRNDRPVQRSYSSIVEPFKCGSKTYCSEMVSCAEARYYLKTCGLTRLDGDSDGVPCEAICQ